jgi:acetate kinase
LHTLLTINMGSSTVKAALFHASAGAAPVESWRDTLDLAAAKPHWRSSSPAPSAASDSGAPIGQIVALLAARVQDTMPTAIVHRIVHGGEHLDAPAPVDDALLDRLQELAPLAPLHQPPALALVRALRQQWPRIPLIACFDTAFHRTMPSLSRRLPIPAEWDARGVRRYGFHGLSYQSVVERLRRDVPKISGQRLVIAHLGNGSSLCAVRDGHSVETTMGFSALDGIPMGTRPGTMDPGVLLYLMRNARWSVDQLEAFLYHDCGLKALSGSSADMRTLLETDSPAARFAVEYFANRIAQATAALATSLGGLDTLVFTGGIGEHAAPVRAAVATRLGWTGLTLDEAANARHATSIAKADSRVAVYVLPADEEAVMAAGALRILRQ